MDLLTLHKVIFFSWLLIGIAYCIFNRKITGKMGLMECVLLTALGPCGWIHIGLTWFFRNQYRKNPDLVNTIVVMVAMVLTIVLMYAVFPLAIPV